ncbi:MAG: AAA family ATPase [Candidatus Omnitrophica bacterium]|nr:AAA family ATPase [Candidatus Omnitrophota bacterium]
MYERYWQLKEKPFENTPNPHFAYYSPKHEEALMRMLYAINEHKGFAVLTGDYGSGKTLLSRLLLQELSKDEKRCNVALIVNPLLSAIEFLREIIYQLDGSDHKEDKLTLLHMLNDYLYQGLKNKKETVVIVDEAQLIPESLFDELRLLLNFQLDDRYLLSLIFIGQPELINIIKKVKQLEQRIAVRYHLTGLEEAEVKSYIAHRLQVAGCEKQIFEDDVCKTIYNRTAGIPRKINMICDMSLMIGMIKKSAIINNEIVLEVIADYNDQFRNDI